ncbi:Uncharacterized protein HZ326_9887 [Fusarium oxysporum f. sp. albedinis]|nr:Uncharacterized protein HZ326_9887 [Fusarium oxysporum f. sp. albedinis]
MSVRPNPFEDPSSAQCVTTHARRLIVRRSWHQTPALSSQPSSYLSNLLVKINPGSDASFMSLLSNFPSQV